MRTSVIVTCKDREDNVSLCLSSIRACRPRPRTILVDFGSTKPLDFPGYKSWLNVIRVDRNTGLFHKARAINIGIRAVETKFLCITDADQIFQSNFFGVVDAILNTVPKSFVMSRTHFLGKMPKFTEFDVAGSVYADLLRTARNSGIPPHGDGCCNGIPTALAIKMRGYDETYVGHRAQDSDFALRAISCGLRKVWIQNRSSMIHLPHLRIGKYYDNAYRNKNREKYFSKADGNQKDIAIANKDAPWGEL